MAWVARPDFSNAIPSRKKASAYRGSARIAACKARMLSSKRPTSSKASPRSCWMRALAGANKVACCNGAIASAGLPARSNCCARIRFGSKLIVRTAQPWMLYSGPARKRKPGAWFGRAGGRYGTDRAPGCRKCLSTLTIWNRDKPPHSRCIRDLLEEQIRPIPVPSHATSLSNRRIVHAPPQRRSRGTISRKIARPATRLSPEPADRWRSHEIRAAGFQPSQQLEQEFTSRLNSPTQRAPVTL